ncbi:MAG: hypothetical protein Q8K10_18735 [Methylobacter sp.]|nr:hypothetical protein [Methylobacter sp.]
MVWLNYRAFWKLGFGSQHIIFRLGIRGVPTVKCGLAYLRRKNQNLVYGCHASGFHYNQLYWRLAMAVLAGCLPGSVAYTVLIFIMDNNHV